MTQAIDIRADALTDHDVYLFKEGTHFRLYEKLGAHADVRGDRSGVAFRVWAPGAASVAVIGDFNGWRADATPMSVRHDGSGIWEAFVADVSPGTAYKYHIVSHSNGYRVDKADPFAFLAEVPPRTASRYWPLDYDWGDDAWMRERRNRNALDAPISIYEVHLGSWRRPGGDSSRLPGYREIAVQLADYVTQMGFTHVELLPVTEHPFYGSWGYQTTGYFAPTSRYGNPQDFMFLVDHLHQRGIGVILDWVPSHFPGDEHGLVYFDGTHLFEHADPRQGFHPEWQSYIFNYGRHEVRAFLASSAMFWLDRYHVDALRVDAVASMLYLDYGRRAGEWVPNEHGGRENLKAVHFLRELNTATYRDFPDTQTVAEESTAWPMVSRPVGGGGLGFGMKWNMGWMHDTLDYMSRDPLYRKYHQNQLAFSIWYAFSENFVLPLSHDEVVYGKGSLLRKMPGDRWRQFAGLRATLGYMWGHPGKKLLFMGGELGQWAEWNHDRELDWPTLANPDHAGVQRWVADLNRFYRDTPAMYQQDFSQSGFEWISYDDAQASVLAFLRIPSDPGAARVAVVCNFTPVPRHGYVLGVPTPGRWQEVLNSDSAIYGGGNLGNLGGVETRDTPAHGRRHSLRITLPPLAVIFLVGPR